MNMTWNWRHLKNDDNLKNEENLKKWKQPINRGQPQKRSQSENEDNIILQRKKNVPNGFNHWWKIH